MSRSIAWYHVMPPFSSSRMLSRARQRGSAAPSRIIPPHSAAKASPDTTQYGPCAISSANERPDVFRNRPKPTYFAAGQVHGQTTGPGHRN